jgi:hypothetical protein
MASIFWGVPVYITVEQVKDSTTIDWLIASADSAITRRILEAQKIIDTFIGSYWDELVDDQATIFPTVNDWIPADITEACLYIVESLYAQGDALNNDSNQIVSETVWDHTVKYAEKKSIDGTNDLVPFKAKNILEQYGSSFFQQTLHQNNTQNAQWVFTANL